MRLSDLELIGVGLGAFVLYVWAGDWLLPACAITLWACLRLTQTHDRLYVLPLAVAFQWSQTSLGVFYNGFTGRPLMAISGSDYRPMVLIALGCVLSLAVGVYLGLKTRRPPNPDEPRPDFAFTFPPLIAAYVAGVLVEGTLLAIAPSYPSLRQIITTLDTARLGVLFLIMRRLCSPTPRWGLLGLIVGVEIVMGITGFFAGFREPIVLGVLAVLEVFDRRNKQHWLAVGVAVFGVSLLGLVWMGIRRDYRREYVEMDQFQASRSARVERVRDLSSAFLKGDPSEVWATADSLVDRMWTIYYPALAIDRVPKVLEYTHGAILYDALVHIVTPRVFFPDKPELMSDSDKVRKYSGARVAGRESNTSIAFGYSAEAYIDFGVPLMFVPVFGFGLFIGAMYALFRSLIWHRELFVAFGTVAFWLSAYLFERSWATMLGVSVGFMVYLGLPTLLLDRFLLVRFAREQAAAAGEMMFDTLKEDQA
jgi:type IV secretory pathway VirB3-like protein